MHGIGGDDHTAGGDFIAHLLGRQVSLALGHAVHLIRDNAEPRVLQLRDRGRHGGTKAQRHGGRLVGFCAGGEKIPGGEGRWRGHAGGVGRRERQGAANRGRVGKTSEGGALRRRRGIVCPQ